ncbi:52 kDa repressor of the inhibitor of the protein kinase-like [Sebastes umbrosus]|uniref:52 kDa repressor of the inhibitor of the protein kinase-like n=1 Tax=Sebastes umbrosus TaxID=72105 RepID=UPI00189CF088|nr:52 kDa repressor of the inhibitor of the protein kinase-like [Sebastes umbrosus]
MVCCFAPRCSHKSSDGICSFYRFPTDVVRWRLWVRSIRRADRKPSPHSRICSCHFPSGKKKAPVLFPKEIPVRQKTEDHSYCLRDGNPDWNELAPIEMDEVEEGAIQLVTVKEEAVEDPQPFTNILEEPSCSITVEEELQSERRYRIQLEIQLEQSRAELESLKEKQSYSRDRYSASQLSESVLRMETGLPDKETFGAVCEFVARYEDSITYQAGWRPKELNLEDQIFMTLMKLRHNYTHLHLAALFHCSVRAVRNVSITFIEVLHRLLFRGALSSPQEVRRALKRILHSGQMVELQLPCPSRDAAGSKKTSSHRFTLGKRRL